MKYNININQLAVENSGLDLDLTDGAIIDFIRNWIPSKKATRVNFDGDVFVWIGHKLIQDQLPILKLKKDSIYRRMRKLCDKGVLLQHPQSKELGMSLYACTLVFDSLLFSEPSDLNPSTIGTESEAPTDENPNYNSNKEYYKNNLYNNKEEVKQVSHTPSEDDSDKVLLTPPKRKRKAKVEFKFPTSFTPDVIKAVESYMQMRKDVGKAIKSKQSFSILCNDCEAILTNYGKETLLYSIECSISAEWQRVYLKQPQGSNGKPQGNLKQPIQITDREMHDKVLTLECTLKNLRIYTSNLDSLKDQAKLDAMQDIYNTHKNKSK